MNNSNLKKASWNTLIAYKNYTPQEVANNLRCFNMKKIFIIPNDKDQNSNKLNTEAIKYFKENQIFKRYFELEHEPFEFISIIELISKSNISLLEMGLSYSDIGANIEIEFKNIFKYNWLSNISRYNIYLASNTIFHPDFPIELFSEFCLDERNKEISSAYPEIIVAYKTMKKEHLERKLFELYKNNNRYAFNLDEFPNIINELLQKKKKKEIRIYEF